MNYCSTHSKMLKRVLSVFLIWTFGLGQVMPVFPSNAYAQGMLPLPVPGTMVTMSPSFAPAIIRGITIYPDNPFRFDFIVDTGDNNLQGQALEEESTKLIKYFLASLTVPEDEFWVNLSPYEKDRIIPEGLGVTEMGRDLLAQDYILKQITASLMYPEENLGSEFWKRVYEKAQRLYGTTDIPVNTFNKVWIVPDRAVVYEHERGAFVGERHLKVMLEEDYFALQEDMKSKGLTQGSEANENKQADEKNSVVSEMIREVLIPELEKEVNEGEHFANLRQIFNSMILATWYKQVLKESLLGQIYVDQNKVKGVDVEDKEVKQKIYDQYVEAFKQGVYDYIKEDIDPVTQEMIPKRYFSGGVGSGAVKELEREKLNTLSPTEQAEVVAPESKNGDLVGVTTNVEGVAPTPANEGDVDAPSLRSALSQEESGSIQGLKTELMETTGLLELSEADQTRVVQALDLLFEKQMDQKRKTGVPYVLHPMEVALNLVRDLGQKDADMIVAAILHDIVEDTDVTIENIRTRFGENVARIIAGLTNEDADPSHFAGMSKQEKEIEKIRLYQRHVLDAVKDLRIFYIKALDLEKNALALDNFNKIKDFDQSPELKAVQARLANKYLALVVAFAAKFKELGMLNKAAQYEAKIGQIEGYARNWAFYEAFQASDSAMLTEVITSLEEIKNDISEKGEIYNRKAEEYDYIAVSDKSIEAMLELTRLRLKTATDELSRLRSLPKKDHDQFVAAGTGISGALSRYFTALDNLHALRNGLNAQRVFSREINDKRSEISYAINDLKIKLDSMPISDAAMLTLKNDKRVVISNGSDSFTIDDVLRTLEGIQQEATRSYERGGLVVFGTPSNARFLLMDMAQESGKFEGMWRDTHLDQWKIPSDQAESFRTWLKNQITFLQEALTTKNIDALNAKEGFDLQMVSENRVNIPDGEKTYSASVKETIRVMEEIIASLTQQPLDKDGFVRYIAGDTKFVLMNAIEKSGKFGIRFGSHLQQWNVPKENIRSLRDWMQAELDMIKEADSAMLTEAEADNIVSELVSYDITAPSQQMKDEIMGKITKLSNYLGKLKENSDINSLNIAQRLKNNESLMTFLSNFAEVSSRDIDERISPKKDIYLFIVNIESLAHLKNLTGQDSLYAGMSQEARELAEPLIQSAVLSWNKYEGYVNQYFHVIHFTAQVLFKTGLVPTLEQAKQMVETVFTSAYRFEHDSWHYQAVKAMVSTSPFDQVVPDTTLKQFADSSAKELPEFFKRILDEWLEDTRNTGWSVEDASDALYEEAKIAQEEGIVDPETMRGVYKRDIAAILQVLKTVEVLEGPTVGDSAMLVSIRESDLKIVDDVLKEFYKRQPILQQSKLSEEEAEKILDEIEEMLPLKFKRLVNYMSVEVVESMPYGKKTYMLRVNMPVRVYADDTPAMTQEEIEKVKNAIEQFNKRPQPGGKSGPLSASEKAGLLRSIEQRLPKRLRWVVKNYVEVSREPAGYLDSSGDKEAFKVKADFKFDGPIFVDDSRTIMSESDQKIVDDVLKEFYKRQPILQQSKLSEEEAEKILDEIEEMLPLKFKRLVNYMSVEVVESMPYGKKTYMLRVNMPSFRAYADDTPAMTQEEIEKVKNAIEQFNKRPQPGGKSGPLSASEKAGLLRSIEQRLPKRLRWVVKNYVEVSRKPAGYLDSSGDEKASKVEADFKFDGPVIGGADQAMMTGRRSMDVNKEAELVEERNRLEYLLKQSKNLPFQEEVEAINRIKEINTIIGDKAMLTPDENKEVGGIDFNPAMLEMQIKRDGNGLVLPVSEQPILNMNIEGLVPIIINVLPVTVPMLLGELEGQGAAPPQLSRVN